MSEPTSGVVFLHGISRSSRSFRRMQAALESAGFATLNIGYASRRKPLQALADDIHPAISRAAGIKSAGGTTRLTRRPASASVAGNTRPE